MKKFFISIMLLMPLTMAAQNTLTPEEQLAKAQKQLEEAQKALDEARANISEANKVSKEKKETPVVKEEARPVEAEKPASRNVTTSRAVKKAKNASKDLMKYLAQDAVPLVNDRVEWETTISAPGKSADEIYDKALDYLTVLTSGEEELPGSQVAIKKRDEHNLVATVHEWLVFSSSALALDRTEIYYVVEVNTADGQANVKMNRIKYVYDVQGDVDTFTAENWIVDKEAVNKKRTRLLPIAGKFRRKTIDLKDELFNDLQQNIRL